jgi:hypothetical protein
MEHCQKWLCKVSSAGSAAGVPTRAAGKPVVVQDTAGATIAIGDGGSPFSTPAEAADAIEKWHAILSQRAAAPTLDHFDAANVCRTSRRRRFQIVPVLWGMFDPELDSSAPTQAHALTADAASSTRS